MIELAHPHMERRHALPIIGEVLTAPAQPLAFEDELRTFPAAGGAEVGHQVFEEDDQLLTAYPPGVGRAMFGASRRLLADDVARPLGMKGLDDLAIGVGQAREAPREIPTLGDRDRPLALEHPSEPRSIGGGERLARSNASLPFGETIRLQPRPAGSHGLAGVLAAGVGIFVGHNAKHSAICAQPKLALAHTVLPDGSTAGEWTKPQIEKAYRIGAMPENLMIEGPR